jgi:nucleoid-associated protein YgaU
MAKKQEAQSFRIGSSYVNLAVGIVVVIAIAALIVGLIRNGKVQKSGQKIQDQTQNSQLATNLPAKHTVTAGEDLWKISEQYYKSGYNWVDIAKANNLTDPNAISTGMELTIPDVAVRATDSATMDQATPAPTVVPTETPTAQAPTSQTMQPESPAISSGSYTVIHGDNLWDIAVRAYGDGYKWVEIAKANNLENPGIIHAGNVLTLPGK